MSTCDKRVGGARRQDPGAGAGAWALPGQPAPTCRFQGDQSEKRCQRADAPRGPAATHSPASLRLARDRRAFTVPCNGEPRRRGSVVCDTKDHLLVRSAILCADPTLWAQSEAGAATPVSAPDMTRPHHHHDFSAAVEEGPPIWPTSYTSCTCSRQGSEKFTGTEATMNKNTRVPGIPAFDPLGEAGVKGERA
ncbi:hypothetical protein MJT46_017355 [Ovis ammon polii x Ovis aries]|nr:hypothetical protein MJT46_017355 [Ovis ammon polii x Ovis aries]